MKSLYGNFRQMNFSDVFPDFDTFKTDYTATALRGAITNDSLEKLYYLLYARYGNSTIASMNIEQFKYKTWSIIFSRGPTWEKELEIQANLRGLTLDEIQQSGKSIRNHAYNPSTEPTTEEIDTVNEQNTSTFKRSKLEGYALLIGLLKSDVTKRFIDEFKDLFIKVVMPQEPLWYVTDPEEETL